ncbi:MAG: hypothetical protein ACHQ2Y_10020 [Candidatus Lutacidiplasmatales archaeon]
MAKRRYYAKHPDKRDEWLARPFIAEIKRKARIREMKRGGTSFNYL